MSRRSYFFAWLAFALVLTVPLGVMIVEQFTGFLWRNDLEFLQDFILLVWMASPVLLAFALTLHTYATRRLRVLAVLPCVVLAVLYVVVFAARILLPSNYGLNTWFWDGFEEFLLQTLMMSLSAVFALRAYSAWATSFFAKMWRAIALAVLALGPVVLLYRESASTLDFDRQELLEIEALVVATGWACASFSAVWTALENAHRRRSAEAERTLGKRVPVRLDCPKCGERLEQPAGKRSRCGACGIGLQVLVEEPRCSCGYLLYDFRGETCPECGLAIPGRWRWDRQQRETGPATAPTAARSGTSAPDRTPPT